jgi:hypothetical protein
MGHGKSGIDEARVARDLESSKKIARKQLGPFTSGGAAGRGQWAVFDPEMSARIQAFGTDLRNPGISDPNFAFSLRDPDFTQDSSYLNTGPITAPGVPSVTGAPSPGSQSKYNLMSPGHPANFRPVIPTPIVPTVTPEPLTESQLTDQIVTLQSKRQQDLLNWSDEEETQLQALLGQRDKLIASNEALGSKGVFSNEMISTLLPQLFRQTYDRSQADRKYNNEMMMYQDKLREQDEREARDANDRKSTFSFMESMFPDIDLSGAGGELDPAMIPSLIQYAMSQASIKANRQNQVMAQPKIQFAV